MSTTLISQLRTWLRFWFWVALVAATVRVQAQTCQTGDDMEVRSRTALESSARRYFDMVAHADYAGLKQNTAASLASDFDAVARAISDNQSTFSGAQGTVRSVFLLEIEGSAPVPRAEFLCGVFGKYGQTSGSAVFVLNNLPPAKYGVAIVDVKGTQDAKTLTLIMEQIGTDWKLAGFYVRLAQLNGHDGAWFAQQAREFKTRGMSRNAWLYYREAITLSTAVEFMSTLVTDKLNDEVGPPPSDLPANGNTVDLTANGVAYRLTDIFPLVFGKDLDVVVKYQAADVSNTGETYKVNGVVTKALVAKFPEFRDAFAGVEVLAVEPSGRYYGLPMAMKDIK